jgi:hypothetical protein
MDAIKAFFAVIALLCLLGVISFFVSAIGFWRLLVLGTKDRTSTPRSL